MVFSIIFLGFLDNKGVLDLGFSMGFLHHVFWLDNEGIFSNCSSGSSVGPWGFHHHVFWKMRAFFHHFLVVGLWWVSLVHSSVGGGTLESHCITFLHRILGGKLYCV